MQQSPMLSAVGRLDKMASGLLLLTQCGPFVHALTSPVRHLDKARKGGGGGGFGFWRGIQGTPPLYYTHKPVDMAERLLIGFSGHY